MNVVYLILDSLNPRLMSRYGHHHKTTPFLDSVIDRFGTVYSNCFTNASFSPIAHRGMMNGMFNVTKMGNNCFRQLESPTVAEIFKQGGHETARFVGLGHMGSQFGFGKGFDTFDEPQVGKDHPNIWCATRWDSYGDIDGKTYSFRMGNYWV
jgi:arylsulfatase A-like enzyme